MLFQPKTSCFLNILINHNLHIMTYFAEKNTTMQATVFRQNHVQNLLSLAIFMLIVFYYAFNGISQDTFDTKRVLMENAESNKMLEFEKSVRHLRAAVLMDTDDVQINGLLYEVEISLGSFTSKKKAKTKIQQIYNEILVGNRKKSIQLINQLLTLLLLQ
jgi:hypothetical protein